MNDVVKILNRQVAEWKVMFVKLHNYHWNVKGSNFFTLHEKFEELYGEAATNIDEIAERVLALKGVPVGTMAEMLELSTIKEATGEESSEEMVQSIINDYTVMIQQLKVGMEVAGHHDDEVTSDMLFAIHTALEKHVWMLSAFLG